MEFRKKGTLEILIGISGSGKSTYAQEKFLQDPLNTVIVNRDKVRELLFGFSEETVSEYYKRSDFKKLEDEVSKFEYSLIREGLELGKKVIIDATHLQKKYILKHKLWNAFNSITVMQDSFDIDLCIERDNSRKRKVGSEIIKNQFDNFKKLAAQVEEITVEMIPNGFINNPENPPAVLFDIDGTLSHKTDRSPYDWKRVGEDEPDYSVIEMANLVNGFPLDDFEGNSYASIICTGRDGVCEKETIQWLHDNHVSFTDFYMRGENDSRPDWVVKEEMWRKIAEEYYIVGIFDDRLQVVDHARGLGLKVFHVEHNNF